jgi:hypothetical protein
MTSIKSPFDPSGRNVSHYTKVQAAAFAKRAQTNTALIRGLLTAIAIPLAAGAAYLIFSGHQIDIKSITGAHHTPQPSLADIERTPAAQPTLAPLSSLPTSMGATEITPQVVSISDVVARSETRSTASASTARPLAVVLDADGKISSPFSVELDANGYETSRRELEEHLALLPPLPLDGLEDVRVLSQEKAKTRLAISNTINVFKLTHDEMRRLSVLRHQAPEVRKMLEDAENITRTRLLRPPVAAESFHPGANNPFLSEALEEIRWVRAAVFSKDVNGDTSNEQRIRQTILLWANTYKPSGDVLLDKPLLDYLLAYNSVRSVFSPEDQATVDTFLSSVIDAQFLRMKAHKLYDSRHALHTRLALATGLTIKSDMLISYAYNQFNHHIANSPLFLKRSLDAENVRTITHLLHAALIFDRSGLTFVQSQKSPRSLASAVDVLSNSSQPANNEDLVNALVVAAYFRPDLYPKLARASEVKNSRFGTNEGALLAAIRKPTSTLTAPPQGNRVPTQAAPRPGSR